MTRQDRKVYHQLVRLAGGSWLVEKALCETSRRARRAPDLKEVVAYIVEHRQADPESETLS